MEFNMKHIFIINPVAGQGKAQTDLKEKIIEAAAKNGADYSIYYTKGAGDGEKFARETCAGLTEKVRFYACGGDGTFSEVANGCLDFPQAEVAVVPVGTGNDFVRNFSDPGLFMDIDAQIRGESIKTDVIRYNDRIAVNMINIGFDCYVAKRMNKIKRYKWIPRGSEYIAALVIEFFRKSGVKFSSISLDGEDLDEKSFLLGCLGNGSFCGGGFKSAPVASITDGEIDICLVRNMNILKCLKIIGKYKKGTFLSDPEAMKKITYKKIKTAEMSFGPKGQYVSFDGEIALVKELKIQVAPLAISISLPAGVAIAEKEKSAEALPI